MDNHFDQRATGLAQSGQALHGPSFLLAKDAFQVSRAVKNPDEIALDLMKFLAMTTGYGKGVTSTGFGGKGPRSAEEYADSLLELYERCRSLLRKTPK